MWICIRLSTYQKKLLRQYERLRRHSEEISFSVKWQRKMLGIRFSLERSAGQHQKRDTSHQICPAKFF
ncbi:hypothetical protein AM352_08210 [Citrobacter koseri]|nr:hypothetical protein AM352_08210 [Citrobacter koseri]PWY12207.1 hypothetical protein DL345_22565 [Citrobacter koseri]